MARQSQRMTDIAYGRSTRAPAALPAETADPLLERELGGPRRVRTGRRGRPRKVDYGFGRSTSVALPPEAAAAMAAANVAYVMRRYAEATTHLLDVVRLCPRAVEPYTTLGMVAEEQGRRDEAMTYYAIALTVGYRHMWRDPDLLSRLARLALQNLAAELAAQRAGISADAEPADGGAREAGADSQLNGGPEETAGTANIDTENAPDTNAIYPQSHADGEDATPAFAITAELELEKTVPVQQMTPAERLYRRRWDAVHYLGRLARVVREPALYWTRARLQAEGGNARHAVDGLAMALAGQLMPGAPCGADADAAALDTAGRIALLGARLGLPHAVGEALAAGLERALCARHASPGHVLACSRAVCAVLWSMAECGLAGRALDLLGALAAGAARDAVLGVDWYVLDADARRVRALALLPPDARTIGHACALIVRACGCRSGVSAGHSSLTGETPDLAAFRSGVSDAPLTGETPDLAALRSGVSAGALTGETPNLAAAIGGELQNHTGGSQEEDTEETDGGAPRDAAVFAALLDAAPPDVLERSSTRAALLYARALLYAKGDAASAHGVLSCLLARPAADADDVDASVLLAQAHAALADGAAGDGRLRAQHLLAAQMTAEAVLAVHPGRADARRVLSGVLAARGLPPLASGLSPASESLFAAFPPLPGEPRPPAEPAPGETSADTAAIFAGVWEWPASSAPEALPLDGRLFTGVLGLRFRPTRVLVAGVSRRDAGGDGEGAPSRRRTLRRRRRKVRRAEAVGVSAHARSRAAALLEVLSLAPDVRDPEAILAAVAAAVHAHGPAALADAAQGLLSCAPPQDALVAAARVGGAPHVRGVAPHVWFAGLAAFAAASLAAGRPRAAADALWTRVARPVDDAARLYTGGSRACALVLRLLHVFSARAAVRAAGVDAALNFLIGQPAHDASPIAEGALASARWLSRALSEPRLSAEVLVAAVRHFLPHGAPAGHAFFRFVRRTAQRPEPAQRWAHAAAALAAESPALAAPGLRRMLAAGAPPPRAVAPVLAGALVQLSMRRKMRAPCDARVEALRLLHAGGAPASVALHNYGRAAHAMGLLDLAAASYRRAVAAPDGGAAQPAAFNLAMVLLFHGQAACARAVLLDAIVF